MKRVSPKSRPRQDALRRRERAPGFCSPMALSMPIGVSQTRCGGLPSRGLSVVPLSTTAPASRLEKPSTRVYSSPNPDAARQQHDRRAELQAAEIDRERVAHDLSAGLSTGWGAAAMYHVILMRAGDSAQYGQHHPAVREHRRHAASGQAARLQPGGPRLRRAGLDYHDLADVKVHAGFDACLGALGRCAPLRHRNQRSAPLREAPLRPGDALLFGPETRGLPARCLESRPARNSAADSDAVAGNRSLNLSNAVALVLYEAWRQSGFGRFRPHGP